VISIDILLCFPTHNFNEIGQSAAGLWQKKTIFNVAAVRQNLNIFIFGHVAVVLFIIW